MVVRLTMRGVPGAVALLVVVSESGEVYLADTPEEPVTPSVEFAFCMTVFLSAVTTLVDAVVGEKG